MDGAEVVAGRRGPYRLHARVVHRLANAREGQDSRRPALLPPSLDLRDGSLDVRAGDGHERLEPSGIGCGYVVRHAVVGADQPHLQRGVTQQCNADGGVGDHHVDVGPLLVHVGDPLLESVVDDADARQLGPRVLPEVQSRVRVLGHFARGRVAEMTLVGAEAHRIVAP